MPPCSQIFFVRGCSSRLQNGSCSVADKVREYDQKILDTDRDELR